MLISYPFVTEPGTTKVRPSVIIQNDVGNRFSNNLIVAAISGQLPTRRYPTNVIVRRGTSEGQGTGLDRDSVVQTENLLTVAKASVVQHLGRFNQATMREIDECLRVSLGLAH